MIMEFVLTVNDIIGIELCKFWCNQIMWFVTLFVF